MKLQIHNVTGWDMTSKSFKKGDGCSHDFETRTITIKSDRGDFEIDLFLRGDDDEN